jgi:deoxyribodipyrimidine photo-lyase
VTDQTPIILWFRRDLRLSDHAALSAAAASGRPVIPVFIHDDVVETLGPAPKYRLSLSVASLAKALHDRSSRLILRRGGALAVLRGLIAETGARSVYWTRLYDPQARARDTAVKAALKEDRIEARSFPGHLLFEPWTVETGNGGFYKVFTPMWKAVRGRDVATPLPAPGAIPAPAAWPQSDALDDWQMPAAMNRGRAIVAGHVTVGEAAARDRLAAFIARKVADYPTMRDRPGVDGTSGLSENLTTGEISAATCWHAGWQALHEGRSGAETFLKELVWREFAYHLIHHTPRITSANWRAEWDDFPWNTNAQTPDVQAWQQGRTGVPFVDAAMRQMMITGTMHNRGRMIVASYLTKHLLTHWKVGMDWFADHLTDWDPASNAMGWQWAAGSGPDAAPYFRIFNPVSQLDKFDPGHAYARTWIAEGQTAPPDTALAYFAAIPRVWNLSPDLPYPDPVVGLSEGRERALAAYAARGGVSPRRTAFPDF